MDCFIARLVARLAITRQRKSRLWVLGFGFWALGFGLWALGFGLWALAHGCKSHVSETAKRGATRHFGSEAFNRKGRKELRKDRKESLRPRAQSPEPN